MATISFTATATTDITPNFHFGSPDNNITYQVNTGSKIAFSTGVAPTVAVTLGDTITYETDGDWSGVTRLFMTSDDISGDISQFSPFVSLTQFNIADTSISGDISSISSSVLLTFAHFGVTSVAGNLGSLAGMTLLEDLRVNGTSVTADAGCLDTQILMTELQAQDCLWSQTEVDACLASLAINAVDVGRVATCTVTMGGTNASLSYPDGRADYDTLTGLGWTMDANTWIKLGTVSDGSAWSFDPRLIVTTDTNMALTITSTDNPNAPEYSNLFEAGDETWTEPAVVAESYFVYVDNPAAISLLESTTDQWINYDGFSAAIGLDELNLSGNPITGNLSTLETLTSLNKLRMFDMLTGNLTGNLSSLNGLTELQLISLHDTGVTADVGCVDSLLLLTVFSADDCLWTQSEVDNCLASLVVNEAAGAPARDCAVTISGTNSAPSNQGADDAFSLTLDGWTVDITVDAGAFVSIKTQTELQAISTSTETLSWNYRLDSDINMIAAHTAIGDGVNNMMGDFNGNGHKINNMTVVDATHMGLFGVSQGDAYDLGLTNVTIATAGNAPGGVGALVGTTLGAVDRCYSTGSVSSTGVTGPDAGGLVGILGGATGIVTDSYSWADVVANDAFGGGLVGDGTLGSVVTCYSIGAVSGTGTLGGLIGSASTVTNSVYNSETSGQSDNDGRGTPLTTQQMQQIGSYTPAELLTNGDFSAWTADDPDGWTVIGEVGSDPMVTEVSGACRMFSSSALIRLIQGVLTVGVTYIHKVSILVVADGSLTIGSTSGGSDIANSVSDVGIREDTFVSLGTDISYKRAAADGDDITFDDSSVTELPFNFNDTWAMVQWDRRAEGRHNPYGTSRHNPVPYPRLRGVESFGGRV